MQFMKGLLAVDEALQAKKSSVLCSKNGKGAETARLSYYDDGGNSKL
jgi:hypothetical protein